MKNSLKQVLDAKQLLRLATIAAMTTPVLALSACDTSSGPAEETGEAIDEAADDVGDAIDDTADDIDDAIDP